MVLAGRRIAPGASPGRKVRTPQGATLRNPGSFGWDTRRRKVERLFDGQCHRKLNRRRRKPLVRVKRCGKSAPREAQATRHGKPRRVQGQIGNRGAARSASVKAAGFGYRSLRQMILSAARRRQNSAYSPSKTNLVFIRRWRGFRRNILKTNRPAICVHRRNQRMKVVTLFSSRPFRHPLAGKFSPAKLRLHSNSPRDPRRATQSLLV